MTSTSQKKVTVYCGELCQSSICDAETLNLLNQPINGISANIAVKYDKFVDDPYTSLSPRIIDLLQLAAHIFCTDRLINRGERKSVDNESWARTIEIHLPVIDIAFWQNSDLLSALSECLQFMTGDRKYSFVFEKAKIEPLGNASQMSLFTDNLSFIDGTETADVMLLSGGLDSLAGAIEYLNENNNQNLITVTHKSNNSVKRTQSTIINYLQSKYNNRLRPYCFECHNTKHTKSVEETQRTRMFLFSAIAYSICEYYDKHRFYVHENGITSINLPSQSDVINARASRTTHPKTIGLLKKFFHFFDESFDIITPYTKKTKEDILKIFNEYGEKDILASSVSCSATRMTGLMNHCGCCSQCVDRRFAAYAAKLDEYDAIYTDDFISHIPNDEVSQRLYNILRLASAEKAKSPMDLIKNYPGEIADILEYWPGDNPDDRLTDIYNLQSHFGDSVLRGAKAMQVKCDDLSIPTSENSFLSMLASKEYLKTPTLIRVEEIDKMLNTSIPQAFHTDKPVNENDYNDTVQALLTASGRNFTREYPSLKFGITSYVADLAEDCLIIEGKYLRDSTTPSKATEAIAADITKINGRFAVLFAVYDPYRKIPNDDVFINDFEQGHRECYVRIYR